jgi:PAS domain S-box-containing protein
LQYLEEIAMTAFFRERVSMREKGLRRHLLIVEFLVVVIPFLVLFYIFYKGHFFMKPAQLILIALTLLLILAGLIILRQIFDRFTLLSGLLKRAEADEKGLVELHQDATELHEISNSFNRLMERLELATGDLQQRLFELLTLEQLSGGASRTSDRDALLNLLLEKAMALCRAQTGSVFAAECDENGFRVIAAKGLNPGVKKDSYVNINDSLLQYLISERKPLPVENIENDPRTSEQNDTTDGAPSSLSMPIFLGDDLISILNLSRKETGQAFTSHDEHMVSIMIQQISFALDNARLYSQLMEHVRDLKDRTAEMTQLNQQLQQEITQKNQLKALEEELHRAYDELEQRVQERTAELVKINEQLRAEIEERKKAEEALRISEERYRELADSITDVFFAMDENLRYVYWNKASENLTGVSATDALGKSLLDIFQDTPQTRRAETVYRDVLRTQHPQTFINEHQLGGKEFFFEISAYPSGRGLTIVAKDITEQRRAEQEKARLQAMLQRAQKMEALGRLITIVAHEILNPVNIISMRLQLMKKAAEAPESIRNAVTICEGQLDRIHEITKNLGEFSRIPKNQGAMSDLTTVIEHVVALYEPRFKMDNITTDLQFYPDLPQIPLDKERIEQVIFNIIANASAAMEGREGKMLRILTRPADSKGRVQVVISDNGTGIERSDAERIFEPYFTTKNNPQDTGMGLFISHTIIQDHGGRIWAENNEWGGASFIIELPEVKDLNN